VGNSVARIFRSVRVRGSRSRCPSLIPRSVGRSPISGCLASDVTGFLHAQEGPDPILYGICVALPGLLSRARPWTSTWRPGDRCMRSTPWRWLVTGERHSVARAKSDHADAMALANILRVDAHLHRQVLDS
jgi:hypothetical protein